MKKIFILLLLTSPVFAEGPRYRHLDQTENLEFQNVYQDLRNVKVSSTTLPPGSTNYIWNSSTLQTGATAYVNHIHVSSGVVVDGTSSLTSTVTVSGSGPETQINLNNTATNGDPVIEFQLDGTTGWTIGLDDSDSDKFKVSASSNLGANDWVTIDSNANATIIGSMRAGDGTASAPGISFSSDTNTGWHRPTTDSITTTVGGSTAAAITAAGEITQPLQPSFLVTNSAGATDVTGDGTNYTVVWGNEIFDQGADFASNTFTAPVTGRYFLAAAVMLDQLGTAHANRDFQLITSNRTYRYQEINTALSAFTFKSYGVMAVIADMDAGDTADFHVIVTGSTKSVDIDANATYNYFSGSLIN